MASHSDHWRLDGVLPDPAALQKEPRLRGVRQLSSRQLPGKAGVVRLPQGSPALCSIRKRTRLSSVTGGIRLFGRRVEQLHLAFQHRQIFLQLFNLMFDLSFVMLKQGCPLFQRRVALTDQPDELTDFFDRHAGSF